MRPVVRLITLACMVAMAGACSAGTTSSNSPAASTGGGGAQVTDPCALLTQADVSQVVGKPVGPGTKQLDPRECDWQYPPNDVPQVQASITIEVGSTFADLCGEPISSGLGITVTQLSGVGDGACFSAAEGLSAGDNLTFTKGAQVFTVTVVLGSGTTADQIEAADKALALAALGHL
jgi:hypothetical protein